MNGWSAPRPFGVDAAVSWVGRVGGGSSPAQRAPARAVYKLDTVELGVADRARFWQGSLPEGDLVMLLVRVAGMQVEETAIPAVKILIPKKHGDARGFFSEVYNKAAWEGFGLHYAFVQDNHSFSAAVGTLRGMHFQTPPFAQDKLVRVGRGRDGRRGRHPAVVADLRPLGRGRIVGRELAPIAGADWLRAWVRHSGA